MPDYDEIAREIAGWATGCTHALRLGVHQLECDVVAEKIAAALAEQRERDAQIAECFGGEGWVSERGRGYADAARRIAAAIRKGE